MSEFSKFLMEDHFHIKKIIFAYQLSYFQFLARDELLNLSVLVVKDSANLLHCKSSSLLQPCLSKRSRH